MRLNCILSSVMHEQYKLTTEIDSPAKHLTALISPASLLRLMPCKTSTRVAQVTGCLPLPVSHSWKNSVLISLPSCWCLWAIILTLDPSLSSRSKVPNLTYLVPTSAGILTTLPPAKLNLNSSGRVGLVPGWWYVVPGQQKHTSRRRLNTRHCICYIVGKHYHQNGDWTISYVCCSPNIQCDYARISMFYELPNPQNFELMFDLISYVQFKCCNEDRSSATKGTKLKTATFVAHLHWHLLMAYVAVPGRNQVAYFDQITTFKVLQCRTSVKGGADTCSIDAWILA